MKFKLPLSIISFLIPKEIANLTEIKDFFLTLKCSKKELKYFENNNIDKLVNILDYLKFKIIESNKIYGLFSWLNDESLIFAYKIKINKIKNNNDLNSVLIQIGQRNAPNEEKKRISFLIAKELMDFFCKLFKEVVKAKDDS